MGIRAAFYLGPYLFQAISIKNRFVIFHEQHTIPGDPAQWRIYTPLSGIHKNQRQAFGLPLKSVLRTPLKWRFYVEVSSFSCIFFLFCYNSYLCEKYDIGGAFLCLEANIF
jgi:hypothetical protein